jgi:hypothetical protein
MGNWVDLIGDGLSDGWSSSCGEKYWVSSCGSSMVSSSSDSSSSSLVCGFSSIDSSSFCRSCVSSV